MGKLKRFIKLGPRILLKKIVGYEEIYTVGIRPLNSKESYKCIPYDKDYWYADPLTFKYKDQWYLFTEAFDRDRAIGRIAVSEIDNKCNISAPEIIISEDYHMSFPYVFEWNDTIYMIPETSENNTINLYKSIDFPYKWELVTGLHTEDGFVDGVIDVISNNRLCIVGSIINQDNPLLVSYRKYYIERNNDMFALIQDKNVPVKWNLRDRNAGKPVAIDNIEFIPTQESSETDYGIKINFRKRDVFYIPETEDGLTIGTNNVIFMPGITKKNMIGVHTYSRTDDYEILDLRYYRFSADTNIRRIKHLLKR